MNSNENPKGNSKEWSKITKGVLLLLVITIATGVYFGLNSLFSEKKVMSVVKTAVQTEVHPKSEPVLPVTPECPSVPICPPTPVCPDCPTEKTCAVCGEDKVCPECVAPECTQPGYCKSYCREDRVEFEKTYKKIRSFELRSKAREGRTFTFIRGELVLLGEDRINTKNACTVRESLNKCRSLRKKSHKYMDGQNECDRKFNPIIDYLESKFPENCQ